MSGITDMLCVCAANVMQMQELGEYMKQRSDALGGSSLVGGFCWVDWGEYNDPGEDPKTGLLSTWYRATITKYMEGNGMYQVRLREGGTAPVARHTFIVNPSFYDKIL